ncbi:MAG: acetoin dehydrogenase subunit dihydrolipoyllysine-residue acetyltransferase [Acidobacteria bacterium]|nr:acetoin dehydrogenase subunit dihydrolipoyllysine-residue acetyltransferase [Acidobacteriota bacterium]
MLLLAVPAAAAQQPVPQPAPQPAQQPSSTTYGYTVFVGGTVVGREDVTSQTTADGLTITGKGRLSGSLDIVMRRAEVRYRADWTPEIFELEATVNGGDTVLQTTFSGNAAVTQGVDAGQKIAQTNTMPPQVLILPNVFFGSYEALTRRLASAVPGQEFSAFLGTGVQGALRLMSVGTERMQVGTSAFTVRRYVLAFTNPRGMSILNVYAGDNGSLLRVNIPAQGLDVMREDLASSTARTLVYSNPGDEAVNIPAAGFNLGATLTRPTAAADRLPAVILLAGAGADDRDGVVGGGVAGVAGVPLLGQIAGALAEAGFLAVRYDKRGHGQSGGRAESATLGDQADDALAVVRWLANRRDVDRDRIAVLGHNEGAWAALLAAARERRIAAVVTMASPSTPGTDRVLEQQRHMLEQMSVSPAELVAKIELQTRINAAVVTGRGWEAIPADMRKQADTPWFQSLLTFDPAKVIKDIRQPLLIVHGELDAEVPVSHVDRLAELAKGGRSRAVAVVTVRGVNHLLLPAVTGDVSEYASLKDRTVSKDVKAAINDWLTKTFAAVR